ncbi:MAG: metallophosphoesterase [Treponema sp.]|nr:metallophosphoesterase [Treponema sp.]MDD7768056.1 metallophosphoesterase [Treponema sp.]MDY3130316.1 metallophosphoesterase [Treponema sp.]MDY5758331.1 metallophosphoesterase [Treponema sp.]
MKILCVSDYVDPLIYNQNVKEIFPDIDAIICAGDLPMDYIDFIVSVFNKPTYFIFGNHNLKDFGFYHKIDSPQGQQQYMERKHHGSGAKYMGFKTSVENIFTIKDSVTGKERPLLMAGVSGSLKYNNGLCQYSDFEMKLKLIKMIPKLLKNKKKYGTYLDIFLTHATPRHIHDHEDPCHKGFECFNWFIEKFKPTYMIHGHIHLYDMREERIGVYNNTTVINAYAHHILEIPEAFSNL